jgi:hypothetical protein
VTASAERPAPYATIIIPTFERAATLGASLRSAQRQTVTDIEILVVGDGCNDGCRSVALEVADGDQRVRFMDLAKAPMNGAANRDLAVREARADRIFYNDDDDLLLPHHVDVLGRGLDHADVVDTPVASVRADGRVDLGLHDMSDATTRRLLAEGSFKPVFDTHLAHRKAAYLKVGAPWADSPDRRSVMHFLHGFASDTSVRWCTVQRITALSFHGARRTSMSPWQRRDEIERWESTTGQPGLESSLRATSGYAFHTRRLAVAMKGASVPQQEVVSMVEAMTAQITEQPAAERARAHAVAAIELGARIATWSPSTEYALLELLGGSLGPGIPVSEVMRHCVHPSALGRVHQLVSRHRDASTPTEVLARLWCEIRSGQELVDVGLRLDRVVEECSSWDRYAFALEAGRIFASSDEHGALARSWCDRALALGPVGRHSIGAWRLNLKIAERAGDEPNRIEAQAILSELAADGQT